MTVANGTEAKDVALHFLKAIGVERFTSSIMGRTIKQSKEILQAGYSVKEVTMVIDRLVAKGVDMYSIGYVSASINDVLAEIKEFEEVEKRQAFQKKQEQELAKDREAVKIDEQSKERNARKARKSSVQSRLREESYLNMLKG